MHTYIWIRVKMLQHVKKPLLLIVLEIKIEVGSLLRLEELIYLDFWAVEFEVCKISKKEEGKRSKFTKSSSPKYSFRSINNFRKCCGVCDGISTCASTSWLLTRIFCRNAGSHACCKDRSTRSERESLSINSHSSGNFGQPWIMSEKKTLPLSIVSLEKAYFCA